MRASCFGFRANLPNPIILLDLSDLSEQNDRDGGDKTGQDMIQKIPGRSARANAMLLLESPPCTPHDRALMVVLTSTERHKTSWLLYRIYSKNKNSCLCNNNS